MLQESLNRFSTMDELESAGISPSNLIHPALDHVSPSTMSAIKFYRGPVPSLSNVPDNAFNFYSQQFYKSQRAFQPTLAGSL